MFRLLAERAYHGVNFGGVAQSRASSTTGASCRPSLTGVAHMRHTHLKENYFTKGEARRARQLADASQRSSRERPRGISPPASSSRSPDDGLPRPQGPT